MANANALANANAKTKTSPQSSTSNKQAVIEKSITSIIRNNIITHSVSENKNITVLIFTAFSMIGIASTVLFGGSNMAYDSKNGTYGPASLTIWGYGIAISSLVCAWLIKMTTEPDDNSVSVLPNIVNVFTVIIIVWVIFLNLTNFKKLNMKKVPQGYFQVSTWSLYLTLMQYAYFILGLYPPELLRTGDNKGTMTILTFIIGIVISFNIALIIIQQIILGSFSVDVL